MTKLLKLKFIFLFFFVGIFAACSGQNTISAPQTQHPTELPTSFYTPTAYTPTTKSTIQPLPSPTYTTTPTLIPLMAHSSNSVHALEVIVFTWDWPMMAGIPPIHIWKDNHAIWVDGKEVELLNYHWTVYETFLSPDEAFKVESVLKNSGFWEDVQQKAIISNASNFVLWASLPSKEKSITVSKGKYETTISSLREILEASPSKTEYFPKQGYLFTTQAESYLTESGFPWPSKEHVFDFSKHEQGTLIDGEILSTTWMAVQQGYYWITYQNVAYQYSLKIPGVSCVISDDPYMCNMYAIEKK